MALQAPPPTPHELTHLLRDIVTSVDERARACNKRWGYNRLPHLVPIEWLEKFRSARLKWQQACMDATPFPEPATMAEAKKRAEVMLRAYDKLEELAGEAGYDHAPLYQWEFELADHTPVILVRDRADMSRVDPKGRACQIWSLDEIIDVIERFPILSAAKACFPGAEVIPMRTDRKVIDALDDSLEGLPF
jgi:hypothetical protein